MIKSAVREIESQEDNPYTDESELVCWNYDHCAGCMVKGTNLLSTLYYNQDVSLLVDFEQIAFRYMLAEF